MAYSKNTIRRAEAILGYGIDESYDAREYAVVDNMVYTDLFTGKPVIEGYSGEFSLRFNGSQRTEYYNEIILKDRCAKNVTVTPEMWGDSCFFKDIKGLLDYLEENSFSDVVDNSSIKSKKIEDFTVTMRDSEDLSSSYYDTLRASWSFYIRNPLIISVSPEQKHDYRYF